MLRRIQSFSGLALGLVALGLAWHTASAESPSPEKKALPEAKPAAIAETDKSLGQAYIANQVLRLEMALPAKISLFNSRGQLLYSGEGRTGLELIPLRRIEFGFLFLTLRQGQVEQSFRLLHNGK
jgi:hypothetical protein